MIYSRPASSVPVDQGDIIDECPLVLIESLSISAADPPGFVVRPSRVYVLTQACDLAQSKATYAVVAAVLDADSLVSRGLLKATDVRGPIRSGRVYGWYFLPRSASVAMPESIVDLRSIHTVRRSLLEELCRAGKRVAHLESLYREHLARHFAETYSRIALPMPYETD